MNNMINLIVYEDPTLSKNTIALPSNIYSEYIKNKENSVILRLPALTSSIKKLDSLNVIESSDLKECECRLSNDLIVNMGFDFGGDLLYLIST